MGVPGTVGFVNLTIPKSALPSGIAKLQVFINNTLLPSSALTIRENATDYFVYFALTFHSSATIDISLGIIGVGLTPQAASFALLLGGLVMVVARKRRFTKPRS